MTIGSEHDVPIKLSVCIATYKRAAFIRETLDAITSQLEPSVELVVVDGASPDETPEVMAEYRKAHPEVRYFREQKNSGVDEDYDKAVGYARGEYCWLMTDDDLLRPGAIRKVLSTIDDGDQLIIVNAEVKTADFSRLLSPRIMKIESDRKYRPGDADRMMSETGNCLSFIGCVVIQRAVWLARDRASFYGSLFVHVGVVFQHPPIQEVTCIAEPLITVRAGNAMWTPRGFEIWMLKWPGLIWSFPDFSDEAKARVWPREPWKKLSYLAFYRATGGYGLSEYEKFLSSSARGAARVRCLSVLAVPAGAANALSSLYCVLFRRQALWNVYTFARSSRGNWVSRWAARALDI